MVQISHVKLETELQYKYSSVFSVSSEVLDVGSKKRPVPDTAAQFSSATNLQQDTAEPVSEASGVSCEGILKEKVKY